MGGRMGFGFNGWKSLEKDGEGWRRPEKAGEGWSFWFEPNYIAKRCLGGLPGSLPRGLPEASRRPPPEPLTASRTLLQSLPQPPRTFFCPLLSTFFTKIAQGSAPEPRALFKNCVWQELFPTLPFLPCNPPTP